MNAVNLLPPKHRPRTPTGGQQGSAYAVIGVLAAILVMALLYVLTLNGINSRKDQVARTKAETTQAETRAKSLSAYGNFSQVKEQRVSSVKQLATGRIDWERLARGLAHVLPEDVWLTSATASATGEKGPGGVGGGAAGQAAPSGGGQEQTGKPTLSLAGCAPNHRAVADTLVRLKELSGAEDVQLNSIEQPETAGVGAPSGGAGSGNAQDCGATRKKANHKFDVMVVFKPNPGATPKKLPRRLGGGA